MNEAQRDYNLAGELLDAFGCSCSSRSYFDFVELVYRIRIRIRENSGKNIYNGDIVQKMCEERSTLPFGFYAGIRRCIKPLLEADEDFWRSLCGRVPKKFTVGEVAQMLADTFEKQGSLHFPD